MGKAGQIGARMYTRLYASARGFARRRVGPFRVLFVIRLAQWPLRSILRQLSIRVPRRRDLIAFGGWSDAFVGNPAHLFLHMSGSSRLRCVWISGSRVLVGHLREHGLAAEYRWSAAGVWAALRSSWYVYSGYRADVNGWLSEGATTFNLWHGVGTKKIQRNTDIHPGATIYAAPEGSWTARLFAYDRLRPTWVLSSSTLMTDNFSSAFGVSREQCPELGYPRNDHLMTGSRPADALVDPDIYRALEEAEVVVGYFPTWRDDRAGLPVDTPVLSDISGNLAEQGGVLLFKAHGSAVAPVTSGKSLIVLPSNVDLNTYLGLCDVLITDYSSVAYDFMLTRRPVILFCPDLERYRGNRGFFLDPIEMTPGVLTQSTGELYDLLRKIRDVPVPENLNFLTDAFWADSARPGAGERVADFIAERATAQP